LKQKENFLLSIRLYVCKIKIIIIMDNNKQNKKKLKSDNSNKPDKGGGTSNKEIEKSVLITDDSATAVAENNQISQVEVKLLKQLSATRQLGGKGTIRRRRLRHKASLVISSADASNHKSEQLRSFLNKFDFGDYGQMERVTFINDNGKFTSYDAINMHSNWKNGMFYLNMSKYRQHFLHKGQRMSRSKLEDESMSSIENNNNDSSSSSWSKGIKIDTAEDLMCTLNYINEQEAIFKQQLNKTDENQIILDKLDGFRTQICEIVGTRDAHTYLSRLIQKNNNNSQKSFSSISNRMSNLSSTNLIDLKNFQLDDEEEIPQLVNDFESVHKQDKEVIVPISFEQSEPQEEPFIYVNLIREQTTTQYNLIETNETKPSEILYKTSITEKTVLVEDDQKEMNENSNDDESSSSTKPILDAILEEDTILSPTSYLEDNEQKLSDAFDFNNKQTTEQQACDDTVMSTIESVTRSIKRKLRKNSKRKSVKLEADTGLVKLKPAESVKTELESEIINHLSTETHHQSPLIKKRKKQKNLQVAVTSKPPLPSIESDSLIPITYKEEQQQQQQQIEQKQNEKKRKKKSSNNSLLKSQTNSSSLNSLVNSSSSGISLSNSAMQSMSTLPTSSVNSINNVIDDSISETEKPIHHKLKSKQKIKSQTETLSIITKNNNIQDQTSLSAATSGLSLAMSTSISGGLQSWSQFSSLTSINDNTNSNNNNNIDELNEIASMIKSTRPIRPKISKSLTERIEINRKSFEDELIQKTVNSRKISNKFLFHKESNLSTSSSSCANLVIEEEEAAAAAATVAAAAAEIQQKLTAEQEKHHLEQINSIDSHEQLIPHPTSSRKSKKIKKKRKLLLQDTNTLDKTNNNQLQQQQQQSVVENIVLAATTPDETKLIIAADTNNIFSEKELNLIKTFTSSVSSSSLDETKEIELLKSITNYQIDILETKRKLKQHEDNEEEDDDNIDDEEEEDDDDKSKRIEKNKNRLINTGSFGISSSSLESEEILINNSGKIF
jgi:hypothetical protein